MINKTRKKVLCCLLCLCMLAQVLPTMAFATAEATAVTASGKCGNNLTWTMEDGVLTISGSGAMWDYDYDNIPWDNYSITDLVLNEGITYIGSTAFNSCTAPSVTIPNSVTSMGSAAFESARMQTVTIGSGLTVISRSAFLWCSSLQNVYGGANVTAIDDHAFKDCSRLATIALSDNLKSIGNNAFSSCYKLQSISLPDGLESIGDNAFKYCDSLVNVVIPDTVTTLGTYAFSSCDMLQTVTVGSGITQLPTQAFDGCTALTTVNLPNTLTAIGEGAFFGDSSLQSITIPSSVTTINKNAFYQTGLTELVIPNGVTTIHNRVFRNCTSLTTITLPPSLTNIGSEAFGLDYYLGSSKLTTVNVPCNWDSYSPYFFNSSLLRYYHMIGAEGLCTICGLPCPHNTHKDGVCVDCGQVCDHADCTFSYTDNGDGTHTATYSCCGTTLTENHTTTGEATCKDKAVCNVCGLSYGELDSDNHVGGSEVRDARKESCTESGYTGDTYCLGCGTMLAQGEEISSEGHSWTTTYSFAEDGSACTATRTCGKDATHNLTATATVTSSQSKAPTCEDMGETTYTAAFAEDWADTQTLVVADIVSLGHDWDDGAVITEATLYTEGATTHSCSRCDKTMTTVIPKLAPAKPYKIANVVSGVHVYWKATEGAVKYGLWRSETGKDGTYKWVANPTVPHFTDTKVESGKTYYYKVTTMDANGTHSGKSDAIGVVYVYTPDITSRSNTAAGVNLGWDKITGATGYAIYRKSYSGTDDWVRIATISGNSTFTWTDSSVKNNNGEVYKYTIRALAGADMKTLSGCRAAGRTMVRLSSQVLTSAEKASTTSIKCSWTTSSRVTGYEVRFTGSDGSVKTFTVGNYKTGVKTFTGLKSGVTYTIQVRTYKKVDGVGSFYSDWSASTTKVTLETPAANARDYVLNTNTMKFHYPSCSSAADIKAENKKTFHGAREELIAQGYDPCGRCHP